MKRHAVSLKFNVGWCIIRKVMFPLDLKTEKVTVEFLGLPHVENAKYWDGLLELDGHTNGLPIGLQKRECSAPRQAGLERTDCTTIHGRPSVVLSPRLLRHLTLQYFTSSQTFSHFFRQRNGRPQTTQILLGRLGFLCVINILTLTNRVANRSLRGTR